MQKILNFLSDSILAKSELLLILYLKIKGREGVVLILTIAS